MKVSFLISSYNGKKDIPPLLDSIENLSTGCHELEVIIRDDNSTDGTADLISKNFPWVRLIRGSKNIGFAKSNNAAITNATGDIICCVNQDTILDPDFLIEGLAIFEKYPETVGINTNMIMPWVLSFEDFKKKREYMPAYEYQLTPYGFAQYVEVDPIARETNFMTGGGFFLRREALLEDEDLFDSSIHMYCEDTELSLRLTKRGGKIMYAPKAVIYHNQKKNKISSFNEF
ncbi:MAG: glycosyltransferase family 2 protein, partial [Desulfobacterales bacterium]|nr:glycosyltransferase family 2 protein [Desulfobacterales bacterium]